jgi:hypothetical protein
MAIRRSRNELEKHMVQGQFKVIAKTNLVLAVIVVVNAAECLPLAPSNTAVEPRS